MSRTSTRPLVGLFVLAVVAALGWWLARGGEQRDTAPRGGPVRRGAQAEAIPPIAAPPPAAERAIALVPEAPLVPEPSPGLDQAVGRAVLVQGRVVDLAGAPVAGAVVRFVPSGATLLALGHELPEHEHSRAVAYRRQSLEGLPLEALPRTTSAADGTFDVSGRTLSEPGDHLVRAPRTIGPPFDALLVTAAGRTTRFHPCDRLAPPEWDAGDLVLDLGARVQGRIVDEQGRPLPGIVVQPAAYEPDRERLGEDAPTSRFYVVPALHRVVTGDDGAFALDGLWPGRVTLSVRTPGRVRLAHEAALRPGETTDLGDVPLPRGGAVGGLVLDATGQPLEGAEVLVTDRRIEESWTFDMVESYPPGGDTILDEVAQVREGDRFDGAHTDASGRFRVEGLDAANLSLYVVADGHEPVELEDVAAGSSDLVVSLPRAATLTVRVVSKETGALLADAHVGAVRQAGDQYGRIDAPLRASAGDEARAAFPGQDFPPGAFLVSGAGFRGTAVTAHAPGHGSEQVIAAGLPAGAHAALTIELWPEAVVEGRVVDAEGRGVAGAAVRLGPPASRRATWAEALSGGDGSFRFGQLGELEAAVYARADGFGESDLLPVTLARSQSSSLELVLPRAARIVGRCLAADGTPLAGSRLSLDVEPFGFKFWELSPEFPDVVETDAEGRFAFEGLSPGNYLVGSRTGLGEQVSLEAGDEREVTLRTAPHAVVGGRVTCRGEPVSGVRVEPTFVPTGRGQRAWAQPSEPTGDDGGYELSLEVAGRYELRVKATGMADSAPVAIDAAAGATLVQDIALPGGSLAGRALVAGSGEPIAGLELSLAVNDDEHVTHTFTDAGGSFAFSHLPPGRYRFLSYGYVIEGDGDGRERSQHYVGAWLDDVEVGSDEQVGGVVLTLQRGGILDVTGLTPDGIAAKDGTRVRLVRVADGVLVSGSTMVTSSGGGRPTIVYEEHLLGGWWDGPRVLRDGRVRFTGLPAGEYRVALGAESPDETLVHGVPVLLGPGETRALEVRAVSP